MKEREILISVEANTRERGQLRILAVLLVKLSPSRTEKPILLGSRNEVEIRHASEWFDQAVRLIFRLKIGSYFRRNSLPLNCELKILIVHIHINRFSLGSHNCLNGSRLPLL